MSDAPSAAGPDVPAFIARWKASGGSERANYISFLNELCDVLGVPRPEPTQTDVSQNAYVFERDVVFLNSDGSTSHGRIDLYKRGCFVLEAKQGSEQPDAGDGELASPAQPAKKIKKGTAVRGTKGWDDAMLRAFGQAEQYARALPGDVGWPPFLIVVDVGHTIELFADFTKSGKTYLQFPDAATYRITLDQLADADQREKLWRVWTDPQSLDPSRRAAKVTRELAGEFRMHSAVDSCSQRVGPMTTIGRTYPWSWWGVTNANSCVRRNSEHSSAAHWRPDRSDALVTVPLLSRRVL